MLHYSEYGASGPLVLIVHGLYGSGRNWGVIAKRLSDTFRVVTPDLRNHGHSPRSDQHDYPAMAEDLAALIEHLGEPAQVCGHSMGGKAAMVLALTQPQLVDRLIVADIAPVTYTHSQLHHIHAMQAVDLARVTRRSDAAAQLAEQGTAPELQSFFTQSLDVAEKRWLLNLDALAANMDAILGFPDVTGSFDKTTLFLSGANSDYVQAEHRAKIKSLFPASHFARIPDAGHWLHAEQPRAFEASLRAFFRS
jgi:pimeloyl-ACP methyl ester carboxylesterase